MPIHIRAQPGDVASIVLLPGDPGRATHVVELLDEAYRAEDEEAQP
jgi:uridine phosphorylase